MYEFVATFAPIHLEPGTYWAASSTGVGAAPAIPTLSGAGGALLGLMLATLALALLARLRAR